MTTHTAVLTGDTVRHFFRRSTSHTATAATGTVKRADAVFGEWGNPSLRPRASQRALRGTGTARVTA